MKSAAENRKGKREDEAVGFTSRPMHQIHGALPILEYEIYTFYFSMWADFFLSWPISSPFFGTDEGLAFLEQLSRACADMKYQTR